MTMLTGILGAGLLFALLAFSATRVGSRLEGPGGCVDGEGCAGDSCSLHDGRGGCEADEKSPAGWWSDESMTYGEQR